MNNLNAGVEMLSLTGLMTEELFYFNLRRVSGEGKSGVLLVFPALKKEDTEQHRLLENILKALNLNEESVFMLELFPSASEQVSDLQLEFNPRIILAFGATDFIADWPDEASLNARWESASCVFLRAKSLIELAQSVSEKKLLWNALKSTFNLS